MTKKYKAMKTISIIFAFLMSFSTTYATDVTISSYENLEEELFINDIPFNTGEIAAEYRCYDAQKTTFNLPEEVYIDDIPFDTACISFDCRYEKAMSEVFNMPQEETIYDLPAQLLN
jgi:hypothetical protein